MMQVKSLTVQQIIEVQRPINHKIFLKGLAGTGKTTVGVERLLFLLTQGVSAGSILVLLPQRTTARAYQEALEVPGITAGGQVILLTLGGLAKRMIELFWPMVAEQAGFARPDRPPVFLTLETAQYYMAHIVHPLFDSGYFASINLDRNRLYSQLLDNLNKAALVRFPYTEIGTRLIDAWNGDPAQKRAYEDTQECAARFRKYCLNHNLLDFSLQIELFYSYLWVEPLCRKYLFRTYGYLIVDNLEEEPPLFHDLLREWLPQFQSVFLIYDLEAGYRTFLGADPQTNSTLKNLCNFEVEFTDSFINNEKISALCGYIAKVLPHHSQEYSNRAEVPVPHLAGILDTEIQRFYPQMLDRVVERIERLIKHEGVTPNEITVLTPYLSDSLRFSLAHRLEQKGIKTRSHRPSRSLNDEPIVRCVFTLAYIAHPNWAIPVPPSRLDFAMTLVQAIEGMDFIRANLLSEIVYRQIQGVPNLSSFERIKPGTQARITYLLGERYERLRLWLDEYRQGREEELDIFFSRLFGELLSQPGYGFHASFTAGEVIANLIESVQKFRWAVKASLIEEGKSVGKEYLDMVREGVISAQYLRSWQAEQQVGVLLAPAYSFLMRYRPVEVQFWLDIGSMGWFERLFQPLTQPYVLSRHWSEGRVWTDVEEVANNRETLYKVVTGLLRRCRSQVVLCHSELGEQGFEQRGQLLYSLQRVLQILPKEQLDD